MNKKGIMLWFVSFGLLIAIGIFFIYLPKSIFSSDYVGSAALNMLANSKEAVKAQLYIDKSAEISAMQSVRDTAKTDFGCGNYLGYSLWSNEEKECYPNQQLALQKFKEAMNQNLNSYFAMYQSSFIPKDNYEIETTAYQKAQTEENSQPTSKFPSLIWPVDNKITSCYGWRYDINGRQTDWHDGIDIRADENTAVKAVADGEVVETCEEWVGSCACSIYGSTDTAKKCSANCNGKCGNYGNYVILKNADNLYSRYNHLSVVKVSKGQPVKQGDEIGLAGNTGLSEASHLDFKIYFMPSFRADLGKGSFERNPLCLLPAKPASDFVGDSCNDQDGNSVQLCTVANPYVTKEGISIKGTAKNSLGVSVGAVVSYSAEQIDAYFKSKNSPLEGLGQCLVSVEASKQIPSVVAMAVTIHESNYGKSGLAGSKCPDEDKTSYNLFSVKYNPEKPNPGTAGFCKWTTTECLTPQQEKSFEVVSCEQAQSPSCSADKHLCKVKDTFKAYASQCDSVNDFISLITSPYYWEGKGVSKTNPDCKPVKDVLSNPEEVARRIGACGYATAATWSDDVIKLIQQIKDEIGKTSDAKTGIGFYSIKPNFKTNLKYSFEDYDLLPPIIKKISEETTQNCMKSGVDTEKCMNELLTKHSDSNFKWQYGCDSNEEKLVYGLAEAISLCSENIQEGYCTFKIPNTEKITLTVKRDNALQKTTVSGISVSENVSQAYPQVANEITDKAVLMVCNEIKLEIQGGKAKVMPSSCSGTAKEFTYDGEIILYNTLSPAKKVNIISFVNQDAFSKNKGKLTKLPLINNIFRVCAKSKYELPVGNGITWPVMYKIAFIAGDKVAPAPVQKIMAHDTPNKEKNITVSFSKNTEPDIDHYNVYYSENDFTEADITKEGIFLFGGIAKTDEETYIRTFKIPKDGNYYVAVTAVDTSNNENTEVKTVKATTVDDLKPAPVESLGAERQPGTAPYFVISINPPMKNTDGSELTDLKGYSVYMKQKTTCTPSDASELLISDKLDVSVDLTAKPHKTNPIRLPDSSSKYCLLVIADDGTESSVTAERYSQNSMILLSDS